MEPPAGHGGAFEFIRSAVGSWAGNLLCFGRGGRKAVDGWPIGWCCGPPFFFFVCGFAAGAESAVGKAGRKTAIRKSADGSTPPHKHRPYATSQLLRHAGAHVEPLICAGQKARNKKIAGPSRHSQFGQSAQNIQCMGKHSQKMEAQMRRLSAMWSGNKQGAEDLVAHSVRQSN